MTVDEAAAAADEITKRWQARFRAVRFSLPAWARDAPDRCLYLSNVTGTFEVFAWDRETGEQRQLTSRPAGTAIATLEPDGGAVWWFDDTQGDEFGVWMRQPFSGGPAEPAVADLAPSYPAGLTLGRSVTAIGRSTDEGTSIYLVREGEKPQLVYSHEQEASVVALSRDETLLAISHSEHKDALKPALRVISVATGQTVGDLWDGPGKGLEGVDFSPVPGDPRLLVVHEREGQRLPLLWDPLGGMQSRIDPDLPGEIDPEWYAEGDGLLLLHRHAGRSELYRFDIESGVLASLPTPPGTVASATARPGGVIEFSWSSSAQPPQLRDISGATVMEPPGAPAPPSVAVEDVWVDGPGGRIHALLARPETVPPYATVFLVHGGPMWHDGDVFAADRAAWIDAGYAVVHVNYRGSTGYGAPWQDAIIGRPGLTELEDIAAVREHLREQGVVDPERLVLSGGSWGGYLTLLGIGREPSAWAVAVAAVPVADYVAAYDDEMAALKAIDRSLFNGAPDDVPELYRECSPITYVGEVRAPLLILAGVNDPRCPIRQIENYLARLVELGKPHEVYRYEAGHGSLVVEERIKQMAAQLDFVRRYLPPR